MATGNCSLHTLTGVRPLYILPNDPLAEEVLIPGFKNADTVDCMVGFFTSNVLASLAPGLATYINNTENRFLPPYCKSTAALRRPDCH